jgi:bifunctional non-homologous end joining protein LigD
VSRTYVETNGKRLSLTNLEKDLYPPSGFTKAGILDYYRGIAPFMLPHLRDRAVTLKRYPDGTDKDFFFEKRCPGHRPDWVQTAEVSQTHGEPIRFCLINDLETLIWAGNLAALELHVPLARAGSSRTADLLVFDLDPGEGAGIAQCAKVALMLRELLLRLGLAAWVKTSGRKGLHVFVPLNSGETSFDDTKTFSKATAEIMQKHYPDLVTARMAKQERADKVFINWSQNDASKTMVCVYSLRAGEAPVVSFPLEWNDLEDPRLDVDRLRVLPGEALRRTLEQGDLFREVLMKEQRLPHL